MSVCRGWLRWCYNRLCYMPSCVCRGWLWWGYNRLCYVPSCLSAGVGCGGVTTNRVTCRPVCLQGLVAVGLQQTVLHAVLSVCRGWLRWGYNRLCYMPSCLCAGVGCGGVTTDCVTCRPVCLQGLVAVGLQQTVLHAVLSVCRGWLRWGYNRLCYVPSCLSAGVGCGGVTTDCVTCRPVCVQGLVAVGLQQTVLRAVLSVCRGWLRWGYNRLCYVPSCLSAGVGCSGVTTDCVTCRPVCLQGLVAVGLQQTVLHAVLSVCRGWLRWGYNRLCYMPSCVCRGWLRWGYNRLCYMPSCVCRGWLRWGYNRPCYVPSCLSAGVGCGGVTTDCVTCRPVCLQGLVAVGLQQTVLRAVLSVCRGWLRWGYNRPCYMPSCVCRGWLRWCYNRLCYVPSCLSAGVGCSGVTTDRVTCRPVCLQGLVAVGLQQTVLRAVLSVCRGWLRWGYNRLCYVPSCLSAGVGCGGVTTDCVTCRPVCLQGLVAVGLQQTVLHAVLSVCRGWLRWGYNRLCYVPSCLSAGVGCGGVTTDCVTCRPVCLQGLVAVGLQQTVLRAVLSVCRGWLRWGYNRLCYMPSCLSAGVGCGGVTTDRVTCRPVCVQGLVAVGLQQTVLRAVLSVCRGWLRWGYNRLCYVPSCLSAGVGCGGVTTDCVTCRPVCLQGLVAVVLQQTVLHAVLSVCRGWLRWGYNRPCYVPSCLSAGVGCGGVTTDCVTCHPVCLQGLVAVGLQQTVLHAVLSVCWCWLRWGYNRPCYMPSCLSAGVGCSGVTTHRVTCRPVCLLVLVAVGLQQTVLHAVLSVCRGWLQWGYNRPCYMPSCLSAGVGCSGVTTDRVTCRPVSAGVGCGGVTTDCVTCRPVCLLVLVVVGLQQTVLNAVLSVCWCWLWWGYNRLCYMPSCLSAGVGCGGVTTDRVTCRPVCLLVLVVVGLQQTVLHAVLSVCRGWLRWCYNRPCYMPSCVCRGWLRWGYNRLCYVLSCLSAGVGCGGVTTDCVTCRPVCLQGLVAVGLQQTVLRAVLSVCRGWLQWGYNRLCYVPSCLSAGVGCSGVTTDCVTCRPVCLQGLVAVGLQQTVLRAVLSVCRGWLRWCYNRLCYVPSCLSAGVGCSGVTTDCVTCRPVCLQGLVAVGLQQTVLRAVLSVCRGWLQWGYNRLCYVPSCLSAGVGCSGVTTDCVTCRPVCLQGLVAVGLQQTVLRAVLSVCRGWLQWGYNRPCYMPSCLSAGVGCGGVTTDCVTCRPVSAGVGCGGVTTDRVTCRPVSAGVGCGGVTTDCVTCCPVCLQGLVAVVLQQTVLRAVLSVCRGWLRWGYNRLCYVLSCLSAGVGCGGVTTDCVTCRPVCLQGLVVVGLQQTVLHAVLSVCRGWLRWCYNRPCYMPSCLSAGVGCGGVTTDCVTCHPVCLQGLVRVGGYNRPCYMPSCLSAGVGCGGVTTDRVTCRPVSAGVGCGGVTTDRVTCRPVCLQGLVAVGLQQTVLHALLSVCRGWLGWGVTTDHVTCRPVCLQGLVAVVLQQTVLHAVLCLQGLVAVGLQQTVLHATLSVCRGWLGWGVTTDHVTCRPVCLQGLVAVVLQQTVLHAVLCLQGLVAVGLQQTVLHAVLSVCRGWLRWGYNRPCYMPSCLSAGVGCGGVTTDCVTCRPVCLQGLVAVGLQQTVLHAVLCLQGLVAVGLQQTVLHAVLSVCRGWLRWGYNRPCYMPSCVCRGWLRWGYNRPCYMPSCLCAGVGCGGVTTDRVTCRPVSAGVGCGGVTTDRVTCRPVCLQGLVAVVLQQTVLHAVLCLQGLVAVGLQQTVLHAVLSVCRGWLRWCYNRPCYMPSCLCAGVGCSGVTTDRVTCRPVSAGVGCGGVTTDRVTCRPVCVQGLVAVVLQQTVLHAVLSVCRGWLRWGYNRPCYMPSCLSAGVSCGGVTTDRVTCRPVCLQGLVAVGLQQTVLHAVLSVCRGWLRWGYNRPCYMPSCLSAGVGCGGVTTDRVTCRPVCLQGLVAVGLQQTVLHAVLSVCRGWLQWGYNRPCYMPSCLSAGVGCGGVTTDRVTCRPVYLQGLVAVGLQQTVLRAVLSVCRGWMRWGYNRPCYVPSCLSAGVGCGGVTTDCVTCRPVCLQGLVRVGGYNRPCYMPSCLSAGVGCGGVTTDRVTCRPVSAGVGCGGVTTDRVTCRPVCLQGLVAVGLQQTVLHAVLSVCRGWLQWGYNRLCYVLSCLSAGVGCGGVTTDCVTCCPVCLQGLDAVGLQQTVLHAVLSVCRGWLRWCYNRPCYMPSCVCRGWLRWGYNRLCYMPSCLCAGVGCSGVTTDCVTCCPVCVQGLVAVVLQQTVLHAVLSVCRGWLRWGYNRPCYVPSCLSAGVGCGGVTTDCVTCCPVCLQGLDAVGLQQTVLRAVLSVCRGWLQWGYNRPCYVPSCLSAGVGCGGVTTDRVTCRPVSAGGWLGWGVTTDRVTCCPVCVQGLVAVGLQQTVLRAVLSVCRGWMRWGYNRPCYMPSCVCRGLVRVGGYNTDRVTCLSSCVCIVKSETFSTTGF